MQIKISQETLATFGQGSLVEQAQRHFEYALETDDTATKSYHIRSAPQPWTVYVDE